MSLNRATSACPSKLGECVPSEVFQDLGRTSETITKAPRAEVLTLEEMACDWMLAKKRKNFLVEGGADSGTTTRARAHARSASVFCSGRQEQRVAAQGAADYVLE
ncbi:hypothetical protein K438DRAFT_1759668 [Mycena galopus ATCC 62051]|nr:hypothetical protein K438DRAFT_1778468 [Mycena galopus ATCC 62051]KAF8198290.1 hypothetical protein K438DRAFT_1759668 [Mycena galopus ATCC 62051]